MDNWPACLPRDPRFWIRRAFVTAFAVPQLALLTALPTGVPLVLLPVLLVVSLWHLYYDYKCYWRALVPEGPPTPYVRAASLGFATGVAFATMYAVAFF